MKLGVFGGTFDPPHNGHVAALEVFAEKCGLDRVLVIPTGTPPHKAAGATSDTDRLEMARRAFGHVKNAEICDYEVKKCGKSYSVETLEWLKQQYPNDSITLYTGSDMLLSFHKWYKVERIFQLCTVAAFSRTGDDRSALDAQARSLHEKFGGNVAVHDFEPLAISSTLVRSSINGGEDFSSLVSESVAEYIRSNNLYGYINIERTKELLSSRLPEKRFNHCLGVAKTAVYLAEKYGADKRKAEIAGLLHDVTKNLSNAEQIDYCKQNDVPLDENDLASPQVIHAKTAEFFARKELKITDDEILSAIRYHTTGHAGMKILDKIVYVSDFIEPNRDYSDVDHYRALADDDLDNALFEGRKWIICNTITKNIAIHPDTIEMYNYIINERT